jgi:hypothetical protein
MANDYAKQTVGRLWPELPEADLVFLANFYANGMDASYHYADDSGKEWNRGQELSHKCYQAASDRPELVPQMMELSKSFLFIFNPATYQWKLANKEIAG